MPARRLTDCPETGFRVTSGIVVAAMGLRATTVTLGTAPAVHAPYLPVAPAEREATRTIEIDRGLHLGATGRRGATAWQRTDR